jgi:hypothetical protein
MMLASIAVTTRQTVLWGLWIALLVAAILFLVAALGVFLRSSKWWGIAVGLVVTRLAARGIAMLDRFGTAR